MSGAENGPSPILDSGVFGSSTLVNPARRRRCRFGHRLVQHNPLQSSAKRSPLGPAPSSNEPSRAAAAWLAGQAGLARAAAGRAELPRREQALWFLCQVSGRRSRRSHRRQPIGRRLQLFLL